MFARPGNNHDPRNRVVAQALGSVFELGQMGVTQCVGPFGPMHGESGDQPLASEGDKRVVGSRVIFHADILRRDRQDVRASLRLQGFEDQYFAVGLHAAEPSAISHK